jgi:hypothetical protein
LTDGACKRSETAALYSGSDIRVSFDLGETMIAFRKTSVFLVLLVCIAVTADSTAQKPHKAANAKTRSPVCPQVLMMEWNGIFYYDTTGGDGSDPCAGAHSMVSSMGVHETGCNPGTPPTCKDPINPTGRDRKDNPPKIDELVPHRHKDVKKKGGCKKPQGRVHLKDAKAWIDEDIHVQVNYKKDGGKGADAKRYFRILVVTVENADDTPTTYCFAQEATYDASEVVLEDNDARFDKDAKPGDRSATINFKLHGIATHTDTSNEDQKQALLFKPID